MTLKKCLIANRGEIAVRIIRACREMGIQTVAVYSDVDSSAHHTRLADQAYKLGDGSPRCYLDHDAVIMAAIETGCDCVHPGYGFLSESPEFAQRVLDAGLTWVGPSPDTIRKMGVKTEARALMQAANVPLVPGFQSEDADDTQFITEAARIGYPVMVKAAGGGGGKGIRIVRAEADLIPALESARREAKNAFNDPRVFLERYIEHGRHVEVQVIADSHGHTLHLFERECSTQRRHQKIIEETPSPLLDAATRAAICAAAVDAARAVNYVNAGTVEFIVTAAREFYFLEMNTRLQVEHPVTELVTGVDLVQLQFRVAVGEALPIQQAEVQQNGHAIECRIYAEDAHNDFLPATGLVQTFIPPSMPGVRVDAGLQSGDAVTIHYDPMVAKIIAYGRTRTDAIQRMKQALRETILLGTTTNIDFLLTILDDPAFVAGEVDTAYVDRHLHDLLPEMPDLPPMALIAAALSEGGINITQAGESDADQFSPWNRGDSFRLGMV